MHLVSSIRRAPFLFDATAVEDVRQRFSSQPENVVDLLVGTASTSPYLRGLMLRHADWLEEAIYASSQDVLGELTQIDPDQSIAELKSAFRIAKSRLALYVALADLCGAFDLEEVTQALTNFADDVVQMAADTLVAIQVRRGKLPMLTADSLAKDAGLVFLAMGKMGAFELNYSSDIDLISLFDDSRFDRSDVSDVRAVLIRVTRDLAAMLSEVTAQGYVFRTDLRLRPDPSVTPVCLSMGAAEDYYEAVGRTWERAAFIKARACAGDLEAGADFLDRLRPFVWRRHLDFAAIQDAHDMRLRIRAHKGLRPKIVLEGHNMKLGAGGIREIEFFTQTRQIISGGRDETLRHRQTVPALGLLADRGWIPQETADTLARVYRNHRQIEHRIQMVNDAQTHDLPSSDEGIERIAALNCDDVATFRKKLQAELEEVASLTEEFFAPGQSAPKSIEVPPETEAIIEQWESYPCLRSERGKEIFHRLKPELLTKLGDSANPTEAIAEFDRFLAGLPAGVQVFSLFEASPHLIDLVVDIAASAPHLAEYLGRNAGVFDAVIGGDFFVEWPGVAGLTGSLSARINKVSDYELLLDEFRRWQKEWHFRIGVHLLRGLITAREAGQQYAELAQATVAALFPKVVENFAKKHGSPPGRGAAIVAMGSLGAERLSAASDLDIILIYDGQGQDRSDGPRPLDSSVYFSRLTQAVVTAMSAPMAEGRLYEVDMRLRPSGRKGPVATSLGAFKEYQMKEAWTWEHLALTRARVVAGEASLIQEVEKFRAELIARPRAAAKIIHDTQEMRLRLFENLSDATDMTVKSGPGSLQDIALFAQAACLVSQSTAIKIEDQLAQTSKCGWTSPAQEQALQAHYDLFWIVQSAGRLLLGGELDAASLGQGGQDMILAATSCKSIEELRLKIANATQDAAEIIDAILANGAPSNL